MKTTTIILGLTICLSSGAQASFGCGGSHTPEECAQFKEPSVMRRCRLQLFARARKIK